MSENEPLAQWINAALTFTEELQGRVVGDYLYHTHQEILTTLGIDWNDVNTLARIGQRLQLIAMSIDARRTEPRSRKLRAVGK